MEINRIQSGSSAPNYGSYRAEAGFLNPANSRPLSIRLSPEARERHRNREEADLGFLSALSESLGG